jgi:hypothetical protein
VASNGDGCPLLVHLFAELPRISGIFAALRRRRRAAKPAQSTQRTRRLSPGSAKKLSAGPGVLLDDIS